MRVIAGTVRGHALRAAQVAGLRPTSDLVRGAIFDMVGPYFSAETRVLDLYAGTGALGIEALSRGAGRADFVEQDPRCCAFLRDNLERTGMLDRAGVHCRGVRQALPFLVGPYALVFLDPPYAQPLDAAILEGLVRLGLVQPGGFAVVEHSRRQPLQEAYGGLQSIKQRRHGDTVVSLFAREGVAVG